MTRIGIILGTTKPARVGPQIADWVARVARDREDAEFTVVDLADHDLPVFNEPASPLLGKYEHAHTRRWASVVSELDGFVFVTPEYNRSVPAALKNAIDYLYAEWRNKAAGIVSYGSQVSGARAAEHLRLIMSGLDVATVKSQLSLSLATDFEAFSTFTPSARHQAVLTQVIGEVVSWSEALEPLRRH
ncbi:NADPH-dependent FMN reductase [Microbacterium sp. NPDC056234]|uniref:NADPH-dependent FMN reductase n=1 Tax=Microbacterium sp. NPDC056234 TaxID=3345757 RepID=UPI0035DCB1EF